MGKKLEQMQPFTRALNKSHLIAAGFSYDDLDRPIIAIANSWNEFNHGHTQQKTLSQYVKAGILAAGGLPIEFHTPGPCDGLAVGNAGMHYILPTRELVANTIEATVSGHPVFDGLVLISSCDKITPGMLIAAARLKMPTIHIAGGPSIPAISFEESKRLRSEFLNGRVDERTLAEGNAELYSTAGNCPYIGTANTMNSIAEALGLALPGSSLAPATSHRRIRFCEETGKQIVHLAGLGLTSEQILTPQAFTNALRVVAALGGSSNYVLHMPAIARRAGIELTLDDIDRINQTTPLLAKIAPNGPYSVVDLDRAGGIPAVMKELAELMALDALTVTGKTLAENLADLPPTDHDIIHTRQQPLANEGGIVILHGNLAAEGAVVKRSAVPSELYVYSGPARVFHSEQDCIDSVQNGEAQEGDVLVVAYEGPKGGPGMREMHRLSNILKAMKTRIALITDGRFSGADSGLMIGYVTPEAAVGGPIGVIQNGDIIDIDLHHKRLDLRISDEELAARLKGFQPEKKASFSELLDQYSQRVGPASEGAIW